MKSHRVLVHRKNCNTYYIRLSVTIVKNVDNIFGNVTDDTS